MRYRPVGDSGLMVSVAGLGCNNFGRGLDLEATRAVVDAAIEAGYRRFIERRLREEFGFQGSPVHVSVRLRQRQPGRAPSRSRASRPGGTSRARR